MKNRLFIVLALTLLWLQSGLFTVDQAEYGYITRFGQPIETLDGGTEAGLHIKWPWPIDRVQRFERRLQVFDLPAVESLTRDPEKKTVDKTLAVDAFVCWRIPDAAAVDRFLRSVGTAEQARRLLAPRLTGRIAAIISNLPLEELIRVEGEAALDQRMSRLHQQLLGLKPIQPEERTESLPDLILQEYGIELVEVRLRRIQYPEAVRASIADRIRSERNRKVADYQSEGDRLARDILSAAERDATKTIAEAKAEKQRIEGESDAQADAIRNQAHAQDREFYLFLQKLKGYQAMLSETRDLLLISSKHEWFDLLLSPPKTEEKK
jgi:modulator of FtsH protease HflC